MRIGFVVDFSFCRLFGISFMGIRFEFGMWWSLNSCGVRTSSKKNFSSSSGDLGFGNLDCILLLGDVCLYSCRVSD